MSQQKELSQFNVPSINLGVAGKSFARKTASIHPSHLPKLENYPECSKIGFDPKEINQEQEVSEDMLGIA